MITNIYRMQAYDSRMCGYFCNGSIDFILKGQTLLIYINLFSPNHCKHNGKTIPKTFQNLKKMKILFCIICGKYRSFEKPKKNIFSSWKKTLFLSIICYKCENKEKNI